MTRVTIEIPFAPPPELLPNARYRSGGHHPGTAATAQVRTDAGQVARQVIGWDWTPLTGPIELELHAAYGTAPGQRRSLPDLDGTIAAAKAFVDGCVDGGVIADDRLIDRIVATHELLTPTQEDPYPSGYTRLTFSQHSDHESEKSR